LVLICGAMAWFGQRFVLSPEASCGILERSQHGDRGRACVVRQDQAGYVRHLADEWATAVTSTAEEYRAKARECEERAAQMPDSYVKEQLLELAKKWRTMAAYEEKHGR
jgi:hypothetical protein